MQTVDDLMPALVLWGYQIVVRHGIQALMDYKHQASRRCACAGPQDGDPLCSCEMSVKLEENLIAVLSEIDGEAALKVLRIRIVKALR